MILMKMMFGGRKIYYALVMVPVATLVIGYLYSVVSYRKNLFPYPQLKNAYTIVFNDFPAEQLHEDVRENIEADADINNYEGPVNLNDLVREGRVIESLTVPFLMRSVDISSLVEYGFVPIKGPAGGVCSSGNFIVLFGGQGNGVLIELDKMTVAGQITISSIENDQGGDFYGVLDVACDRDNSSRIAYVVYQTIHL
ncbi:MAG: hypothetical protein HN572_08135, partial [Kordiimonadaceae bacterium]|nr:hypothetical protein [Kordiimonadaceae bacterium]